MTLDNLKQWKKIHMIGIGGVSMSGLAEHLTHFDFTITGSDAKESDNTRHLKEIGIDVTIGHDTTKIDKTDLVVYTAAIPKTDEEFQYAKSIGKQMMERSEFLGELTKCYQECICISGTHGKTTTTSMIATCFLEANLDPTIEVGAYLKEINGNNKTGNSEYFILEACEYVDSFLQFHPHTEIILNIDNDHLDYFKNIDNIKQSFKKFTEKLNDTGTIIANIDDENTKEVVKDTTHNLITYSLKENATFKAINIQKNKFGFPTFDVLKEQKFYGTFELSVLGTHNILNALATIATCDLYKMDLKSIQDGLIRFTGANRRFEKIGTYKNIPIFDDYAHHPTEIETTYQCSQDIPHKNTWAIFEPHTYSRTEAHLNEFAEILAQFDHVILSEIYAARETNSNNISSKDLEIQIKKKNPNCIFLENYEKILTYLKENVLEGDIIITIGAGTINKIGYTLKDEKQAQLI